MLPETIMKGRSSPLRCRSCNAAEELKVGMEWSEITNSQSRASRAASIPSAVSTLS
jgi:hypothetical protein